MMVHFDYYPKDRARIRVLERRLERAIRRAGVGELGETSITLTAMMAICICTVPIPIDCMWWRGQS